MNPSTESLLSSLRTDYKVLEAANVQLIADVSSLRIALNFYANDANWSSLSVMERGPAVDEDGGNIARKVLRDLK